MTGSRLLTPFENQGRNPSYETSELPLPRPSFASRISATPSGISLGKKIQRHLDAGMPLYIGLDPADPQNADGCEKGGQTPPVKRNKPQKWLRVLTLGVPLDTAAKSILTVGMVLALLALLWAMNGLIRTLIYIPFPPPTNSTFNLEGFFVLFFSNMCKLIGLENRRLKSDFDFVMIIGQFIWGIFLGAPCIFGMELMWGKWRVS